MITCRRCLSDIASRSPPRKKGENVKEKQRKEARETAKHFIPTINPLRTSRTQTQSPNLEPSNLETPKALYHSKFAPSNPNSRPCSKNRFRFKQLVKPPSRFRFQVTRLGEISALPFMGTIRVSKETLEPSSPIPSPLPSQITTSTSRTETVNGSHEFKIAGYSLSKGMGIGKYIASDTFMVGGHLWAIYFYPDGKSVEDNTGYVSLFIALASEGTDVRALFELSLLDQSGKGRHKVHSHFGRTLESVPYTLKYRGCMWGYKRFLKRTALETSDFLKDDCLLIHCTVGVVKSHTETPKSYTIQLPPSNIGQHFGQLLESGEGADVSFEVDGETFAAHKSVLAARSPVFRAQFFGPLRVLDTRCIKVEEIEAPIFKALLHFIYWDALPDMQELVSLSSRPSSTLMAQHLLAAADRYDLDRLRLLCEAKLCEDIAINTVATTLALAEQHHCLQLKVVCLKFISQPENLKAVMQTDGFEYLKRSCPPLLTELLEHVARMGEHCSISHGYRSEATLDGSAVNGRRVKQRIY